MIANIETEYQLQYGRHELSYYAREAFSDGL